MKNLKIIFLFFVLLGCKDKTIKERQSNSTINTLESGITAIEDDFGPPFKDTCSSSFEYIGELRLKNERFDLIISGNNWNPDYQSCTYIWGELINNSSAPDTLIKDFRIHLIEVDSLPSDLDSTFFDSKVYQSKLIATYSKDKNEEYMTCKFDPNKTGKYPKPKQWVE